MHYRRLWHAPGNAFTLSVYSVSRSSSCICSSLAAFFFMYCAGLDAANMSGLA